MNAVAIKSRVKIESRIARGLCLRCPMPPVRGRYCDFHADENGVRAASRFVEFKRSAVCVVAGCGEVVQRSEQLTIWGGVDVVARVRCREHETVHRFKQALQVACRSVATQGTLL